MKDTLFLGMEIGKGSKDLLLPSRLKQHGNLAALQPEAQDTYDGLLIQSTYKYK